MPDNNIKIIDAKLLERLNSKYDFSYDNLNDEVLVAIKNTKKVTRHSASKSFRINAKKENRVIVFNVRTLNIWKELQKDSSTRSFSLIDIHNAILKLKTMYQEITTNSVKTLLLKRYTEITKI